MAGLKCSSTERMSTTAGRSADQRTDCRSRRSVEPVVERICELWLRIHGYGGGVSVEWADINLQDEVEEAKAALYLAQAERLREGTEE